MIDALAEEVATLREENQRLAREHYRPASASRTAAEIRKVAASLEEHPGRTDDTADSAVAIALETEMIRRGLVEVCELLQSMAAQLSASLTNGVPLHEIDRRLRDRPVEADRRHLDLTSGVANGVLTNGAVASAVANGSNGNDMAGIAAHNGHHELPEPEVEVAVASARNGAPERHLQVLGEDKDLPISIVRGNPGASEWESPRSAVYDRVSRAEAVGENAGEHRVAEGSPVLGRSGYYDRVQRSDGGATR